jgi:hypothetical protein
VLVWESRACEQLLRTGPSQSAVPVATANHAARPIGIQHHPAMSASQYRRVASRIPTALCCLSLHRSCLPGKTGRRRWRALGPGSVTAALVSVLPEWLDRTVQAAYPRLLPFTGKECVSCPAARGSPLEAARAEPCEPCRSISSKMTVGRSCTGGVDLQQVAVLAPVGQDAELAQLAGVHPGLTDPRTELVVVPVPGPPACASSCGQLTCHALEQPVGRPQGLKTETLV